MFYADSNTNRVHAAGAYDPHALFSNVWINSQIRATAASNTAAANANANANAAMFETTGADMVGDGAPPASSSSSSSSAASNAAKSKSSAATSKTASNSNASGGSGADAAAEAAKAANEAADAFAAQQTYAFGACRTWLRCGPNINPIRYSILTRLHSLR